MPGSVRTQRWLRLGVVMLLIGASASTASADADWDREAAWAHMDQGDALIDQQKFTEALEAYRKAHALMGVPTTGIEVAKTLAKLGRIVEAKRVASEVASYPVAENEPEPFAQARRDGLALREELEPRVPRLTVRAAGASSLVVDGASIPDFRGTTTLELETGNHVITVVRAGQSSSKTVSLSERERTSVTFESSTRAPSVKPETPTTRFESTSPPNTLRTVGWIGVGVGAAGLAFGAVTGGLALQSKSKLDDGGCSGQRCPASKGDEVDRYNTLRTLSSVGLIGGAVVAAAGAVLVGVSGSSSPQRERGKWRPAISASTGGAGFTF